MTSCSVVPFKFDFDPESFFEKIEFKYTSTTNGVLETVKVKVPLITGGASLFQVLFTINKFSHANKALSLATGPKLYDKFSDLLRDYANQNWWVINTFINHKFNNNTDVYQCHKRFLDNIKKTTNMTVHQFVPMVTFRNHNLIFESMPIKWKDSYEEHHSPYGDTITQIVTRMKRYQNKENEKSKKTNHQDNASQNNNNNNSNNNNSSNNCNNDNHRNNNQNNSPTTNAESTNAESVCAASTVTVTTAFMFDKKADPALQKLQLHSILQQYSRAYFWYALSMLDIKLLAPMFQLKPIESHVMIEWFEGGVFVLGLPMCLISVGYHTLSSSMTRAGADTRDCAIDTAKIIKFAPSTDADEIPFMALQYPPLTFALILTLLKQLISLSPTSQGCTTIYLQTCVLQTTVNPFPPAGPHEMAAALLLIYVSKQGKELPIVIGTGTSASISPVLKDFIRPPTGITSSMEGLTGNKASKTANDIRESIETKAYFMLEATFRLFSSQSYIDHHCAATQPQCCLVIEPNCTQAGQHSLWSRVLSFASPSRNEQRHQEVSPNHLTNYARFLCLIARGIFNVHANFAYLGIMLGLPNKQARRTAVAVAHHQKLLTPSPPSWPCANNPTCWWPSSKKPQHRGHSCIIKLSNNNKNNKSSHCPSCLRL
eukprot:jgi/Psemu1/20480/gm1.20480_g